MPDPQSATSYAAPRPHARPVRAARSFQWHRTLEIRRIVRVPASLVFRLLRVGTEWSRQRLRGIKRRWAGADDVIRSHAVLYPAHQCGEYVVLRIGAGGRRAEISGVVSEMDRACSSAAMCHARYHEKTV